MPKNKHSQQISTHHAKLIRARALDSIQTLYTVIERLEEDIANGKYVKPNAPPDRDCADTRFGDEGWIEEMDILFAAATYFFQAKQYKKAFNAYQMLFNIFELAHEGYGFTCSDPVGALNTDIDVMIKNVFIALQQGYTNPIPEAIETSNRIHYYSQNHFIVLDVLHDDIVLRSALERALIDEVEYMSSVNTPPNSLDHPVELLWELYRRHHNTSTCETLCQKLGTKHPWTYLLLFERYQAIEAWAKLLTWANRGLTHLPADTYYYLQVQEYQGLALLKLNRPSEALDVLQALFQRQKTASVYLKLRQAAQALGQWGDLYPKLTAQAQANVPTSKQQSTYDIQNLRIAVLLGYAYLLDGDWQTALNWALTTTIPQGGGDYNLVHTVAAGLLKMGFIALNKPPDEILQQTFQMAPALIREHGQYLEAAARNLPPHPVLDGAVTLYEMLLKKAVNIQDPLVHTKAIQICKTIQVIRHHQNRQADFQHYYQQLLTTLSPDLKNQFQLAMGK